MMGWAGSVIGGVHLIGATERLLVQDQEASAALEALHEVPLPEAIGYWPQTVAWYVVFVLLLALGVRLALRWHRHRRANRYRKVSLARLAEIEHALASPEGRPGALAELPALVKRTALAFEPRSDVAGLSGDGWLGFLDASFGRSGFTDGPGRLLSTLAYAPPSQLAKISPDDVTALVGLIRAWIGGHRARA